MPLLVRWPGRIAPGLVTAQVGITMDLSASFLAAAGVAVPAGTRYDGIDLFPVLAGGPQVPRTLCWRTAVGGFRQAAVRDGDLKLLRDGTATMLFDVGQDPGERHDIAGRGQEQARRLQGLLAAWEREVGAAPQGAGAATPGGSGAGGAAAGKAGRLPD